MTRFPVGIEVTGEGAHPASWRFATDTPAHYFDPHRFRARFAALDDSLLSFAILGQHHRPGLPPNVQGQLDSVEAAAHAAALTEHISVLGETNAIHAEPFHVANQLNSLDWSAKGRSGWLVGNDDSDDVAASYGRRPRETVGAAHRETRDVITAVRRLWDSWEDDIFLADESSHRFLDLDRWHYADFEGEFFSVKGPGLLPRPPQGQPPIWSRDLSPSVAPLVDIALVSAPSATGTAQAAQAAARAGVSRSVAEVEIVLDAPGRTAQERLEALDAAFPWAPTDRLRVIGSVDQAAQRIIELSQHVDGIHLHPAVFDVDVPVIVESLLPALDRAGVLRPSAPTLRELFGLARPENIFTAKEAS